MKNLTVFSEDNKYFGIFSDDYESSCSMEQFIIMQHNPLKYFWKFTHLEKNISGSLLNLGWMFDEDKNHFNINNQVFLVSFEGFHFGIKMEQKLYDLPLEKDACTFIKNETSLGSHNFTLNMLVNKILVHKSKKIFILEPNVISNYFRNIL